MDFLGKVTCTKNWIKPFYKLNGKFVLFVTKNENFGEIKIGRFSEMGNNSFKLVTVERRSLLLDIRLVEASNYLP